ncbi:unannotated protein [freshwater metagenome]|uniref:Unannotated protein n=1 Tax=freshwater metagenome TaxID=449393 RepID=A0A6J6Q642_9ZZZZ
MYGWRGVVISETDPTSTVAPACITTTRSQTSSIRAKSCEIKIIAVPNSLRISLSNTMIWAWTVTSRPVVGSSAISNLGLLARAQAIMTRWRIPPESWLGYCFMTVSIRRIFTSSRRALDCSAIVPFVSLFLSASESCAPIVNTGFGPASALCGT